MKHILHDPSTIPHYPKNKIACVNWQNIGVVFSRVTLYLVCTITSSTILLCCLFKLKLGDIYL